MTTYARAGHPRDSWFQVALWWWAHRGSEMKKLTVATASLKVALKGFGVAYSVVDDLAIAVPGYNIFAVGNNIFWIMMLYGVVRITWIWKHQ